MLKASILLAALALASCTTSQEVRRPDGASEFLVACGASTGWDICYGRANELCPTGWNTIRETPGFNRKEMLISCPRPRPAA